MQVRESHSMIFDAVLGEQIDKRQQLRILPPSKFSAGKRLIKANKRDEIINEIILRSVSALAIGSKAKANIAKTMLAIGPDAASKASFLYVQPTGHIPMRAPKRFISMLSIFIFEVRAKTMCPNSWMVAASRGINA